MNIFSVFDLLLITVLFFRPALSEILEDPSLLETLAYDYIVVGGACSKPPELDLIDRSQFKSSWNSWACISKSID